MVKERDARLSMLLDWDVPGRKCQDVLTTHRACLAVQRSLYLTAGYK